MRKKKDATTNEESKTFFSSENLPSQDLVRTWLLDTTIFSDADLRGFLFLNIFTETTATNLSRKKIVQKILQTVLNQNTFPFLCQRIFDRRPYLKNNERPKLFNPRLKQEMHKTFTAALCYIGDGHYLDFALEEFGIYSTDYFATDGLFHTYVWECISEIERGNHTEHPRITKLISQMGELKKRLRRIRKERFGIPQHLPYTLTEAQFAIVAQRIAQLDEDGILSIVRSFNFMAIPYPHQSKSTQAELITTFAQETKSANKLIAALHHHYPNLDLTEFGLVRRVRSALNIQAVRHFSSREVIEKAQQYPFELPYPTRLAHFLKREKEFTRHKAARIGQILGYQIDPTRDKLNVIEQLVNQAQAKSEIRVLINAILALYDTVSVPSISDLTKK